MPRTHGRKLSAHTALIAQYFRDTYRAYRAYRADFLDRFPTGDPRLIDIPDVAKTLSQLRVEPFFKGRQDKTGGVERLDVHLILQPK